MSEKESNGISFKGTLSEFKSLCDSLNSAESSTKYNKRENILTFKLSGGRDSYKGEAYEKVLTNSEEVPEMVLESMSKEKELTFDIVKYYLSDWLEEEVNEGEEIDEKVFHYEVEFFKKGLDTDKKKIFSLENSLEDEINGWTIEWNRNIEIEISIKLPDNIREEDVIDFSKLEITSIEDIESDPCDESIEFSISPEALKNINSRVQKLKGNEDKSNEEFINRPLSFQIVLSYKDGNYSEFENIEDIDDDDLDTYFIDAGEDFRIYSTVLEININGKKHKINSMNFLKNIQDIERPPNGKIIVFTQSKREVFSDFPDDYASEENIGYSDYSWWKCELLKKDILEGNVSINDFKYNLVTTRFAHWEYKGDAIDCDIKYDSSSDENPLEEELHVLIDGDEIMSTYTNHK